VKTYVFLDSAEATLCHVTLMGALSWSSKCPRAWHGVFRHPGCMLGCVIVLRFSPLGVFGVIFVVRLSGIHFVRGLPQYLLSFGHVDFIYKMDEILFYSSINHHLIHISFYSIV
jgi:hypothetical protein